MRSNPAADREGVDRVARRPLDGVFAANRGYWTVGLGTALAVIKDLKGLAYIQHLLRYPGREFHAIDILSVSGSNPTGGESGVEHERALPVGVSITTGLSGDAGEMLDSQAKLDYRRRIDELRERRADLQERGEVDRAEECDAEIRFLTRELVRALDIHHRDRRAGSSAERARLNVSRAVRGAIEKISERDQPLGRLLQSSIRTGSFCSYLPPPDIELHWRFSLEDSAPQARAVTARPSVAVRRENFLSASAQATAFVGRENELAILTRSLERALTDTGRTILIDGAPGVGKTRIAAELGAEAARRGMSIFAGSCYDREDPVPFIAFVEILEAILAQIADPVVVREALGDDAGEVARLLPQLLRTFPDIPPPIEAPPQPARRILFDAVGAFLCRLGSKNPALLVLDDLHWADEGTLLLLRHVAQLAAKSPLLIVGNYRNIGFNRGGPLGKTLEELLRLHLLDRMTLSGLPEGAVAEMLHALSGQMPPSPVVRVFYADTEGNPFLMEELFRHLAEQGKLFNETGEFRADIKATDLTVPESLRLVTGRRLARLEPKTLKILDSAAVIGRSFTFQLLASSTQADPDSLLDSLEEAENAGLISSSVQYPDAQFRFSHELIRRSVVDRISIARRQHLHLAIAKAIELTGAGSTEKVGELAYHLVQAGASADGAKTARILALAARQALAQGALTEAEAYFQQAQDVLDTTAPGVAHDRQELALQLALGQVFMATRGYVAPETVAAYDRARVLSERLGEPMQVMLALIGQFSGPLLRGEGEGTGALANAIFATAEHIGSSPALTWGNFVQGVVAYHRGDLHDATRYLEAAIEIYRSDDHFGNPQDPGTEALGYLALTCWQRGLADTARARMRQAVALAEKLHKPFALVHIRFYEAYLSALLRDSATTLRQSQPAIDLAQGQSVPLFFDAGRILLGWAMAEQGRYQEGLAMARAGLASYMAAGNRNSIARFLGLTAEIEGRAASIDPALTTVEEAFASSADELIDRPYLLWLRGKLLYERAGQENCASRTSDLQAAEKNFRDSVALADRMGAQSYALRAATSLAQLLNSSSHRADAQQMLGPSLAQFVEGFDTRDLIEARAVASGVS